MVLEFGLIKSGLFPTSEAAGEGLSQNMIEKLKAEEGTGVVPIGTVLPWAKTLVGVPALPSNFQECDGAAITDGDSPMLGQNTPNLNGSNRFPRGANTSGGTGGAATHTHTSVAGPVAMFPVGGATNKLSTDSHLPKYYNVVFVMRIK